jgi:hypothetical protein
LDLFGITRTETLYLYPEAYLNDSTCNEDRWAVEDAAEQHEEQFLVEECREMRTR